jgi:hypothetical protein
MQVAQRLLGPLSFEGTTADLECPARALHTVKDKRLARLFLDGAATITCFHSSCSQRLDELSRQLRKQIWTEEKGAHEYPRRIGKFIPCRLAAPRHTPDNRFNQLGGEILTAARRLFPSLTAADLWESSPVRPPCDLDQHFPLFIRSLWAAEDVLWCGDLYESGKPCHAKNFRTAAEWLSVGRPPGPHTSAWTFAPGSSSRCKAQARSRRFLVLESDSLSEADTLSVLFWLREKMQLRLRAVVHSGNKSLHAWFDLPQHQLGALEAALPRAGFDSALFTPAHTSRLAGWKRTDKAALPQRLMFLDA